MAITVDLHSHTRHSHAKDSVADMAASALGQGLKTFGFSEHSLRPAGYAYPNDYQPKLAAGFADYIAEVAQAQKDLAGRLEVLLGLELDYIPAEQDYAAKAASAYPYDYVIGGLHFQGKWGFDCTAQDWVHLSDDTCADIFSRYYQDLRHMAQTGLFNIAAHPDLIKLFRPQTFAAWLKGAQAQNLVHKALEAIKEHGLALEVSSAALRKGLHEPYPCPDILKWAWELDIPITFGSDAHATGDVAFAFDTLATYASGFGYTASAVFHQRRMELRPFTCGRQPT